MLVTKLKILYYSVLKTFINMSNTDNDQFNAASTSAAADETKYRDNHYFSNSSSENAQMNLSTDHREISLQGPNNLKRKIIYCPICDDSSEDEESSEKDNLAE